ncbi:MAG: hypothetical protein IKO78_04360 [Bacilli bacterium]|nr:hypothetical protein [Bacilli bacterium]
MKNKKILYIIIAAVLVVAGVLLCFFLWPRGNKKEVYVEAVKNSMGFNLDEVKERLNLDNAQDKIKHVIFDGSLTQDGQTMTLNGDAYISLDEMYLSLNTKKDKEDLNLDLLYKENKIYIIMKNILDNIYYYALNNGTGNEKNSVLDYSKLLDIFDNNFEKIIKEKNIEVSDEKIIINGNEYSTKKYSYNFSGNDFYELADNIINDIKNDKELYGILSSLIGTYGSNLESFSSSFSDLESFKKIEEALTYTVFLKDDEVISTKIILYIPATLGEKTASMPVTIIINKVDGYYQAYITAMGMKIVELEVNKKSGEMFVALQGNKIITGTISDDKITLESTGDQLIKFKLNIETDKANNSSKINFEFADRSGEFTIKGESVDKIPNVDVSGAIPFDKASDKDKAILDKFFNFKNEFKGLAVTQTG